MKKIPTMFVRVFENHKVVRTENEFTDPSFEEVLKNGIPTIKFDGACCAIINGEFYKRYDAKKGKPIPENAIKCQEEADPVTGHLPCWVPVDFSKSEDKWFVEAYDNTFNDYEKSVINMNEYAGTYEAIGPHFQGNPYNHECDHLIKHGVFEVYGLEDRTFTGILHWLETHNEEGIVFWDAEMTHPVCKIKRSDFGLPWPIKN